MDELNEFIENELLRIKLSEDDWGWLTFEDESRKNTLLEIRAKVKTLGLLPVSNMLNINRGFAVFNEAKQELIFSEGENIKIV